MKKNIATLLGIAFVVAVIATGVFYGLVAGRVNSASADEPKVSVVVAGKALTRGATLAADDLKVVEYAVAAAPKGALSSIEEATGLATLEPIGANQPILSKQIVSHTTIPTGMRVVSVRASDSTGVVALLKPGYHVDIQVIAGDRQELGLKTLVQNVSVLGLSSPDNGRPVVNLLVTPEEAELIGLADSTARVRLALRNPQDTARTASNVVRNDRLSQDTSRLSARP